MHNASIIYDPETLMSVTLTIKQVPDDLADRLRLRAEANRRSLQRELLLIIEHAADASATAGTAEPAPVYHASVNHAAKASRRAQSGKSTTGRLSLDALWQRARKLGASMPSESADLIRRDRDARHRR